MTAASRDGWTIMPARGGHHIYRGTGHHMRLYATVDGVRERTEEIVAALRAAEHVADLLAGALRMLCHLCTRPTFSTLSSA